MTCGIYAITNKVNGKRYVGSSKDIERRWYIHKLQLSQGNHHSSHLQHAWDKYERSSFEFTILENCLPEELLDYEQGYLDTQADYNTAISAKRPGLGMHHTDEAREKIRQAGLGRRHSEESKKKLSKTNMGHVLSEETKDKIRASLLGRKSSKETCRKISRANLGRPPTTTKEGRIKMSLAHIGLTHATSDKTKKKMSLARKKYWDKKHAETS